MKTIRQRFHQQIVQKYKSTYFANVRKQILEVQQFKSYYNKILDNNQNLTSLVQKFGYLVFYKHISQVLDEKLYQKLYQNDKYFIDNLSFVSNLLECRNLPIEQIAMLVSGLSEIIKQNQYKLSLTAISHIFSIVETVIQTEKYSSIALGYLEQQKLIRSLYELTIARELNQYFFKIIGFCKTIKNQLITNLTDKQLVRCLTIHILTSNRVEELFVSYSMLADLFHRLHQPEEELYEYGSILDKTMKDIVIERLIDPISYFLIKALTNQSLIKLALEMNFFQVIFDMILNVVLNKNTISVFGHQSLWCILKKLVETSRKMNKFHNLLKLDWYKFRSKLQKQEWVKYPYVKVEILECLKELSKTCLNDFFAELIVFYQEQIGQLSN